MHHADRLFARIIVLDGHPNLKTLDAEHAARTLGTEARRHCDAVGAFVARAPFDSLGGQQYGILNAKPASKAEQPPSDLHNRGTAIRHMAPRSRESARRRLGA